MAKIEFTHYFDVPMDEFIRIVFNPSEDEINDLTKLPNVQGREEVERYEDDKVIRTIVRYYAIGFIPPAARKFVKPHMLSWLEYSTWDKSGMFWEWRNEPYFFKEIITCNGRMSVLAEGARTKRVTRGTLEIRFPVLGEMAEKIILEHLKRNFDSEVRMFHETQRRIRDKRNSESRQ